MAFNASPNYAGSYLGVRAPHPPNITETTYIPGPHNWQNVTVGDINIYVPTPTSSAGRRVFMLVSLVGNQALWVELTSTSGGTLVSLTGNDAVAVVPDGAGNINILTANSTVKITGNAITFTETIDFGLDNLLLGSDGALTSGVRNVGLGFAALQDTTTGNDNTGIGYQSLLSNVSGLKNTAVGSLSSNVLTTGSENTAIGYGAYTGATNASGNIAIGVTALSGAVINPAQNNLAIGNESLLVLTTGANNVALGDHALSSLTTGGTNIAVGVLSGSALTNTSNNINVGNTGTLGDANTIRIGTQGAGSGQQNKCFIAGIAGATGLANPATVVVNTATGQLGIGAGSGPSVETITGNSGGALSPTAGNFNFTGGTTGLTFSGAASTETLTGTLVVANGGTGNTGFNTEGVIYYDGTKLASTSVGTAGQILTSNGAGVAPTFQNSAATTRGSVIGSQAIGVVLFSTTGGTKWISLYGAAAGATQILTQGVLPLTGTLSNMYVYVISNSSNVDNTITLNRNAANTTIQVTVPALASGVFTDLVHTEAFTAGDLIQWECTQSTGGNVIGNFTCLVTS